MYEYVCFYLLKIILPLWQFVTPVICSLHNAKGDMSGMCRLWFCSPHSRKSWLEYRSLTQNWYANKERFQLPFWPLLHTKHVDGLTEWALVRGIFKVDFANAKGFHTMQILWPQNYIISRYIIFIGSQNIRHKPLSKWD